MMSAVNQTEQETLSRTLLVDAHTGSDAPREVKRNDPDYDKDEFPPEIQLIQELIHEQEK